MSNTVHTYDISTLWFDEKIHFLFQELRRNKSKPGKTQAQIQTVQAQVQVVRAQVRAVVQAQVVKMKIQGREKNEKIRKNTGNTK